MSPLKGSLCFINFMPFSVNASSNSLLVEKSADKLFSVPNSISKSLSLEEKRRANL